MREDDAPRRGSAYARPDPTGHVIAKQARRAFEASRGEDESGGESVRYVRSLRYLPRERGEDGEDVFERLPALSARTNSPRERERFTKKNNESSTHEKQQTPFVTSFGYATTNGGVGGVGAFAFPATRSVMWDPSAIAETTHISAEAHAVSVSVSAGAAAALAEGCAAAERETQNKNENKQKPLLAAGAFVASRRVLDRRGAFRASAALEIFAVGGAPSETPSETACLEISKHGTDREEAWSSPVAVAVAAAPPGRNREALEAMTDMTSHRKGEEEEEAQKGPSQKEEEDDDFRLASTSPLLSAATPWRARLAATERQRKDGRVELVVSARVRVPAATFAATPIAPPRVADSPLSGASFGKKKVSTGFLTMDRTRRLMLLDETDPRVSLDLPTVGVWVSGVTNPTHLAVWTACFRYATSDALKDKATQRGAFLCLLCPPASHAELGDDAEKKTRREGARAPPATCYDVRLVEPRGVSPRTHVDLAATFACVPGEAAEAHLAPPPAIRAERNADARSEAGDEKSADTDRVTLRRRVVSSETDLETNAVTPTTPIPSPSSESVLESRRRETKRERASPDWAPVYGAAPRTAYEAAAAAAAARAAAANAKLAASRGATPSSLMSPVSSLSPAKQNPPGFPETPTPRLEGAARVVVEEQQRVIAELRAAVAFLETEMAELTRPVSAREREARARDLLGGLEGATDFAYAARDGELPGEDGDEALGELLPGEPPTSRSNDATSSDPTSSDPSARGGASPASKSPLRKALAFARGGEAPATASDAALCASFRSDRVGATYGTDTPEGSVDGGAGDAAADTAEAQAKKKGGAEGGARGEEGGEEGEEGRRRRRRRARLSKKKVCR
jgi:hypothetical protein